MRKFMVGLMVLGLLAVAAAPAVAQQLDPLGLITSGAVLPYFGGSLSGPDFSFIEVYAPISGNSRFHMFFFDENCNRVGPSVGLPLTTNDVEILLLNLIAGIPSRGLITAADVDNDGFTLNPTGALNSFHARVWWFNSASSFARVLEPIALGSFEFGDTFPWNPLRTSAAFFAPLDQSPFATTIYLVCPNSAITSKTAQAFPESRFPALVPPAQIGTAATPLKYRVYDDEEGFIRNVPGSCHCLSVLPVKSIDPVYGDATFAPNGTYTEVEGGSTQATPYSFTGYRALRVDPGTFDLFGRLSNGFKCALSNNLGSSQDDADCKDPLNGSGAR